jgi:hypothetical protein
MCRSIITCVWQLPDSEINKRQARIDDLELQLSIARSSSKPDRNLIFRLTEDLDYANSQIRS